MQILYKKKLAKICTLLDDEKQGLQEVSIKQYKFIVSDAKYCSVTILRAHCIYFVCLYFVYSFFIQLQYPSSK